MRCKGMECFTMCLPPGCGGAQARSLSNPATPRPSTVKHQPLPPMLITSDTTYLVHQVRSLAVSLLIVQSAVDGITHHLTRHLQLGVFLH